MTAETASKTDRQFRPTLTMLVGMILAGLGLLFVPESGPGGIHMTAIGVSLFLSGFFGTRLAARQWDLSSAKQRQLSLVFTVLAGILLALFLFLNW